MMSNDYIVNGDVQRDKITMDIKYRKITRAEIESLCNDPKIQDAFIGTAYNGKKPRQQWNKDHLDVVSYAVVAESFNRDHLLYLDDVAEFVSKAKFKTIIIAGIIVILVIIAGVIVYTYSQLAHAAAIAAMTIR